MWIRSQSKNKLIKCSKLYLAENDADKYEIIAEHNSIGEYSTYEKASKVLDMIEFKLRASFHDTTMILFQMPLDSEVSDE